MRWIMLFAWSALPRSSCFSSALPLCSMRQTGRKHNVGPNGPILNWLLGHGIECMVYVNGAWVSEVDAQVRNPASKVMLTYEDKLQPRMGPILPVQRVSVSAPGPSRTKH